MNRMKRHPKRIKWDCFGVIFLFLCLLCCSYVVNVSFWELMWYHVKIWHLDRKYSDFILQTVLPWALLPAFVMNVPLGSCLLSLFLLFVCCCNATWCHLAGSRVGQSHTCRWTFLVDDFGTWTLNSCCFRLRHRDHTSNSCCWNKFQWVLNSLWWTFKQSLFVSLDQQQFVTWTHHWGWDTTWFRIRLPGLCLRSFKQMSSC